MLEVCVIVCACVGACVTLCTHAGMLALLSVCSAWDYSGKAFTSIFTFHAVFVVRTGRVSTCASAAASGACRRGQHHKHEYEAADDPHEHYQQGGGLDQARVICRRERE